MNVRFSGCAVDPGGVAGLVDHDAGGADFAGSVLLLRDGPGHGEPDACFHLGRAGGVKDNVIHGPGRGDCGHAAFGQDQDQGCAEAGGLQQLGQGAGAHQVLAGIQEDDVARVRFQQGRGLGREDVDAVVQQLQGRQDVHRRAGAVRQ